MRSKKIVILSGVSANNIGDDAMLMAVVYDLQRLLPDAEITILSDAPEKCSYLKPYLPYPIERSLNSLFTDTENLNPSLIRSIINRFALRQKKNKPLEFGWNLLKWVCENNNREIKKQLPEWAIHTISLIQNADLVFDVGGANLNEIWKSFFYEKCFTFLLAKDSNKPLILSGESVEPMQNQEEENLLQEALSAAELLTFREKISEGYALSIGARPKQMLTTGDDSLTLPIAEEDRIKKIWDTEGLNCGKPYIGFQFRNYLELANPLIRKKVAAYADAIIDEIHKDILFIPMHYGKSDERYHASLIKNLMKNTQRVQILMGHYSPMEIKGIMSKTTINIGISYHFFIFSASVGVPIIPLFHGAHYTQKFNGLTKLYETPGIAVEINNTSIQEILKIVKEQISCSSEIRNHLLRKTEQLTDGVLITRRKAVELLL